MNATPEIIAAPFIERAPEPVLTRAGRDALAARTAKEPIPVSPDRDYTIKRIRAALKRRSGKSWSVKGGNGTAWGWIKIESPPRRRDGYSMTEAERVELGELMGLNGPAHHQGVSVPDQSDYRREHIQRAEGMEVTERGVAQWD